ncbi:MAG TPA: hypothetical protein VN714_24800 [Trebonia sp.]|nr:hypothetical protein [Trebonia sp.]
MSDHDMRTLLRDLADRPEPASTIDLAAARRTGKRRLWLRNGGITAAVAAIVLSVAVVIPRELAAPAPSGNPTATGSKDHFNPFIPDAAFGYVPPGYELKPVQGLSSQGFTSTANELTLSVKQTSGGGSITLDVLHKGDCGNVSMDLNLIPAYRASHAGSKDPACRGLGSGVVVTNPPVRAPDVAGRPAYWLNTPDWSMLAWQYAPGAWALLEAFTPSTSRAPITADRPVLLKVARTVKFGQTKPIMFPFKLSGAIASGWTPNSVFFTVTPSGQYLANMLEETAPAVAVRGQGTSTTPNPLATEDAAGAYAEVAGPVNLLTIIASTKPYDFTCAPENPPGNSLIVPITSVRQIGGVSWLFQTDPKSAKLNGKSYDLPTVDQACNQQPGDGLRVNVRLDVPLDYTVPSFTALLDGLSFSADPQTWTTTPLPG